MQGTTAGSRRPASARAPRLTSNPARSSRLASLTGASSAAAGSARARALRSYAAPRPCGPMPPLGRVHGLPGPAEQGCATPPAGGAA